METSNNFNLPDCEVAVNLFRAKFRKLAEQTNVKVAQLLKLRCNHIV